MQMLVPVAGRADGGAYGARSPALPAGSVSHSGGPARQRFFWRGEAPTPGASPAVPGEGPGGRRRSLFDGGAAGG